jgi:hypothetical protein
MAGARAGRPLYTQKMLWIVGCTTVYAAHQFNVSTRYENTTSNISRAGLWRLLASLSRVCQSKAVQSRGNPDKAGADEPLFLHLHKTYDNIVKYQIQSRLLSTIRHPTALHKHSESRLTSANRRKSDGVLASYRKASCRGTELRRRIAWTPARPAAATRSRLCRSQGPGMTCSKERHSRQIISCVLRAVRTIARRQQLLSDPPAANRSVRRWLAR